MSQRSVLTMILIYNKTPQTRCLGWAGSDHSRGESVYSGFIIIGSTGIGSSMLAWCLYSLWACHINFSVL